MYVNVYFSLLASSISFSFMGFTEFCYCQDMKGFSAYAKHCIYTYAVCSRL